MLNPFASLDRPLTRASGRPSFRETQDHTRRAKQETLGVEWKKRQITTEQLRARGIRLSQQDLDRYDVVRKQHAAFFGSEEPRWAEWMFLEGADSQGGVAENKNPWFGDSVLAFYPHKLDDVLHRTDALLFFLDEENERKAYPVSVDVTVNEDRIADKMEKDFDALASSQRYRSNAYWIDTASDEAGEAIDEPREGIVQTVPVSIYLPGEVVEKFQASKTSLADAEVMMRRLKPFVLEQMRIEMEAELLYIFGAVKTVNLRSGEIRTDVRTRDEFLELLKHHTAFSGPRERAREILTNALQSIWKEQEKVGRPDPAFAAKLPEPLRRLAAMLPTAERERAANA